MPKKKKTTALARRKKKTSPKRSVSKRASSKPTRKKAPAKRVTRSTTTTALAKPRTSISRRELPALPTAGTTDHLAAYGASTAKFTRAQTEKLMAEWPPHQVEIRYDRIVYVEAQKHRDRLTEVFGPGGWAEVPGGEFAADGGLIVQLWQLFIGGVAITQSLGECQWVSSNTKMTKGDAVEGAKSNALTRNCKGIMNQQWRDKTWAYNFTLREGVLVKTQKGEAWRKVDGPPADREKGIDDRSPNRHRYQPPTACNRCRARHVQARRQRHASSRRMSPRPSPS